ncbi:MAG: hypothetical protein P1T08_14075 [Acidimicrobiia bacterium]|nr:hypothetical protein [Acidimicrobiia bacterium]
MARVHSPALLQPAGNSQGGYKRRIPMNKTRTSTALILMLVTVSCGSELSGTPGSTSTTSGFAAVQVNPALEVGPMDAVVTWWSPSPWSAIRRGSAVELLLRLQVGDEDSETVVLQLIDDNGPFLGSGSISSTAWDGAGMNERTTPVSPDDVTIRDWDLDGVVGGVIRGGREDLRFWVDLANPIQRKDVGASTWLEEGGLVEVGGAFVQFVRILNDSRCPLDVTCVWAGELTVEMYIHSEVAQSFELTLPGDPVTVDWGGLTYQVSIGDALPKNPIEIELLIESA